MAEPNWLAKLKIKKKHLKSTQSLPTERELTQKSALSESVREVRLAPKIVLSKQKEEELQSMYDQNVLDFILNKIQQYNTALIEHNTVIAAGKILLGRSINDLPLWQIKAGKYRILAEVDPTNQKNAHVYKVVMRKESEDELYHS